MPVDFSTCFYVEVNGYLTSDIVLEKSIQLVYRSSISVLSMIDKKSRLVSSTRHSGLGIDIEDAEVLKCKPKLV